MKFGKDTGSMANHLYAVDKHPRPEVGMGVTFLGWTDRSPGTIVAVEGSVFIARTDSSTRVDDNGMSENQEYVYSEDEAGATSVWRFDEKTGRYEGVDRNPETNRLKKNGRHIALGFREKYHDYSF